MGQTEFSPRTMIAMENCLRDPGASKEILGTITELWNTRTGLITEYEETPIITFDASQGDWHEVVLTANRTLKLINVSKNQEVTIVLTQGATGNISVTWFDTIRWSNGTVPNLSSTIDKSDIFKFKQIDVDKYFGWVVGQKF